MVGPFLLNFDQKRELWKDPVTTYDLQTING